MYTFDTMKKTRICLSETWNRNERDWNPLGIPSVTTTVCVIRRSIYEGMSRFLASSNTARNIVHSPERDTQPIVNLVHNRQRILCFVSLLSPFFEDISVAPTMLAISDTCCFFAGSRRSSRLLTLSVIVQTSTILGNHRFNYFKRSSTHLKCSAKPKDNLNN